MKSILLFLIDHFPDLMDINLTASVVIVFVICVRQFLKRAPKIFSYALWGIVLLRLLVPISIESPVSFVPERTEFSSMVEMNEVLPEIAFETPQDRSDSEWDRENTPAGAPPAQEGIVLTAQTYLTFVWLFGIALMLLYSLVSYWKLRRKLKVVAAYRKGIFTADDIGSPFVMGIFRPAIYLPGSLDPWERTFIIAHEQHHIRRGDHIFKALAFLALTIHWFNPFVWVAFVLASRDMEMSCDEAVIRKYGEDVRADYSAALLNLATGRRIFTGTPLAFGEGNPTGRVHNLAKWKKPKRWIILVCVILCVVLAVCLLTDPEIIKPMELPQQTAQTRKIVMHNDPLPNGYFESRDEKGNLIITDGINTIGGVVCYRIPEGIYDPDDHIEALLYKMGIPDYVDPELDYRGGMTSGDNGWLAEFESDVAEGEERTVHRRHHFYHVDDVVYDIWFDRTLLDYETTEEIRVCINLPVGEPTELKDWGISIKPDRVSRTGATALFVYSGSIPGEEGAELTYGDFLSLDRMVDGNWVPCDELAGYNYYVGDSSYPVVNGYGMVHEWPDRFGELPDGQYRLGKQVTLIRADGSTESRMVYGEFSLPESVRTGRIPLNELPENYSAEEAAIDGCLVTNDGIARDNKELFHRFAQDSWTGTPCFIRIVDWHYGDNPYYIAYDLKYDGSMYTLSWYEDGQLHSREFPYIRYFFGEDEDMSYEHYVLIHDEMIDRNIWGGMIGSHESIYADHMTVYSNYTDLPKTPQLPQNLTKAVLEFGDKELVSTTDFDRLEKIWILFSEAELLGYEPKTHSIGVGLNLILTSQSGETITVELDPDSDICRINGEYVFYGAADEPAYIEKLWYYLGIPSWPDPVYENCPNAYRP